MGVTDSTLKSPHITMGMVTGVRCMKKFNTAPCVYAGSHL